jgi:hypothetical protein
MGEVHLFDIQWEKYGTPRFVVNFGTCPEDGLLIDGKRLSSEEVAASWAPVRGRLQPKRGFSTRSWFRQDKPLLSRLFSAEKMYPPSDVVAQLLKHFEELEEYWSNGNIGVHMQVWTDR